MGLSQMISELGKVLLIFFFLKGITLGVRKKAFKWENEWMGLFFVPQGIQSLKGRAWLAVECVCTKQLASEEQNCLKWGGREKTK